MKFTTIVGIGALVGLGIYASQKLSKKAKDESVIYTEEKETLGDKVHNASMYAVGTVRTGIDKIAEGMKEIPKSEIVKKGEETVEMIKDSANNLKKDIEDLKNMVVSINVETADEEEPEVSDEVIDEVADLNAEFGAEEETMETSTDFDDLEEI